MDQGNHLYDDIWHHELKPGHLIDELAISQSLLYLIRLNSPALSLLKRRLNQPATDKLRQRLWSESGRVLGLPIRGSDKCGDEMFDSGGGKHRRSMYESSCLPWSEYVEAIDSVRRYDPNVTTILVTSEDDVRYIQLAKAHASALWRNGSRSVRFVFNDADVSLGSGQPDKHVRGDPHSSSLYVEQVRDASPRSHLSPTALRRSCHTRSHDAGEESFRTKRVKSMERSSQSLARWTPLSRRGGGGGGGLWAPGAVPVHVDDAGAAHACTILRAQLRLSLARFDPSTAHLVRLSRDFLLLEPPKCIHRGSRAHAFTHQPDIGQSLIA
jgi:hypothetical protein